MYHICMTTQVCNTSIIPHQNRERHLHQHPFARKELKSCSSDSSARNNDTHINTSCFHHFFCRSLFIYDFCSPDPPHNDMHVNMSFFHIFFCRSLFHDFSSCSSDPSARNNDTPINRSCFHRFDFWRPFFMYDF